MEQRNERQYFRLRGLPWSATKQDVVNFLDNVMICEGEDNILFTVSDIGKKTGDAVVVVPSRREGDKMWSYHRKYMGRRYIEVVSISCEEYNRHLRRVELAEHDRAVRLRGLPYSITKLEIERFFDGLNLGYNGVVLLLDEYGQCPGEGYVEFATVDDANRALKKHGERIGNRFIEVYRCSVEEMLQSTFKDSPVFREARERTTFIRSPILHQELQNYPVHIRTEERDDDHRRFNLANNDMLELYIHMRGLPYDVSVDEIEYFFHPVPVAAVAICFNHDGKPLGECDVFFHRESDVMYSMEKNNQKIDKRYVELFLRARKLFYIRRVDRLDKFSELPHKIPPSHFDSTSHQNYYDPSRPTNRRKLPTSGYSDPHIFNDTLHTPQMEIPSNCLVSDEYNLKGQPYMTSPDIPPLNNIPFMKVGPESKLPDISTGEQVLSSNPYHNVST